MTEATAHEAEPAVLFTLAIQTGSEVTVSNAGAGERGTWRVTGQVAGTNSDDPAYDVIHTRTGRRRIFRSSKLDVVRSPRRSEEARPMNRKGGPRA